MAARPEVATSDMGISAWHFCDNKADADELAQLVTAGRKCATAGSLWSYEADGDPLPRVGDFNIITDWSGEACCVIRTSRVDVVPFDEVSEEFAATEAEGDGSLAYWREVHEAAFRRELASYGREFDSKMPVVCERFDVVFPVAEASAHGRE